jgi:Ca-activated chloride channel family protein
MKTGMLIAMLGILTAGNVAGQDVVMDLGLDRNTVQSGTGPQRIFLKLGLIGARQTYDRPPLNVSIVLDRSGSMEGEKLARAKEAAEYAVGLLGPQDLVSIVIYDDSASVLVPSTPARNRDRIIKAIRRIESGGNTALFAGVALGAGEVRRFAEDRQVRRVILLSDGLANVGPSSTEELGRLGSSLRKEGISVSTIGLGSGYNEDLMARLAFNSDGNHAFVQEPGDLVRIFDSEFKDAASIVASDVDIIITCKPGVRPVRIINRDGDIVGQEVRLRLNQILGTQEKYVLVELELPDGRAGAKLPVAEARTSYLDLVTRDRHTLDYTVSVVFSSDGQAVQSSIRKDVKEQVILQLATEANEEAVRLADEGQKEEAKKILEENSAALGAAASELASPVLRMYADQNASDAESIADDENWDILRKSMLEEQSENKTQRSY